MAPSIYKVMIPAFNLKEEIPLGIVNSVVIWLVASSAIFWGFLGDKGDRKQLLLIGTLIWSTSLVFSPLVTNIIAWLIVEVVAAIGLGAISSIGFSVIADYISVKRRGIAFSFWTIAQSMGSAAGKAVAGFVVTELKTWWLPYILVSLGGFLLVFLYFFTIPPQRGATEEELKGKVYNYTIKLNHIKIILKKPTNFLLMVMGFILQIIWGAFTWLPFIYGTKIADQFGCIDPESKCTINASFIGNIISALFWAGGFCAIIFAWLGDKLLKKTLKARPIICLIGLCIGAPMGMLAFSIPFDLSSVSGVNGSVNIIYAILGELLGNRLFLIAALVGFISIAFLSADNPNFLALGSEVNLPEHRSTGFGILTFIHGIGRGIGSMLVPIVATLLTPFFGSHNWFASLSVISLLFIPTALCYVISFRYVEKDYSAMKQVLKERAEKLRNSNEK
ncbi:MAG: MFS transporter [Candidatus Hodarchaeota archaeon]